MKTAHDINDNFRKEIRNRQKQQLFRNIRSQYDKFPPTKSQMISDNNMQSRELQLRKLRQQIKRIDGVKICNKLLDQKFQYKLIQNLKCQMYIQASLEVLSAIFAKQKIKVAHKFVKLGLIEVIIKYSESIQYVSMCMNILANIIFQNPQFSEMMLQNNIHKHLCMLLRRMVLEKTNVDTNQQQNGFTVMLALAALLQTDNAMNYKQQFLEILQFAIEIYKKQLYIGVIIQIILLVGYAFKQETQQIATNVVHSILQTISKQTVYLEHLLITIKILSPININYAIISNLVITAQPKQLSYCVRILSRICSIYPSSIPKESEWWQRFYLKLLKIQDIEQFMILLRYAKVKQQFSYRIIKDVLQRYSSISLTLTNETLICINTYLQKSQSSEQRRIAKFYIKTAGIYECLQKLYHSKNPDIHRKCQYLLTAISMSNSLSL